MDLSLLRASLPCSDVVWLAYQLLSFHDDILLETSFTFTSRPAQCSHTLTLEIATNIGANLGDYPHTCDQEGSSWGEGM